MGDEYEIDDSGYVYKNGRVVGYIRNFPGCLNIPTASEVAKEISYQQEREKDIRKWTKLTGSPTTAREVVDSDFFRSVKKMQKELGLEPTF